MATVRGQTFNIGAHRIRVEKVGDSVRAYVDGKFHQGVTIHDGREARMVERLYANTCAMLGILERKQTSLVSLDNIRLARHS